jgi:hypothetical protein
VNPGRAEKFPLFPPLAGLARDLGAGLVAGALLVGEDAIPDGFGGGVAAKPFQAGRGFVLVSGSPLSADRSTTHAWRMWNRGTSLTGRMSENKDR